MKTKRLIFWLMIVATAVFVAACDQHVNNYPAPDASAPPGAAPGEVEVAGAPPPAEADVETPSPGPDFVWIGGAWVWGSGGHWEWEKGRWDRRPHPGAVWAPHRYEERGGHHVFVRGGWH